MTVMLNFTRHHFHALSKEPTSVNLNLVIQVYKPSNICQRVLLKIVVVHKLVNYEAVIRFRTLTVIYSSV